MSYNSMRNTRLMPGATKMPAATNGHGRLRNERHAPNRPGDSGPDQPRQKQAKSSDDEGSLSSVKSCDIEDGGDDGHSDGAEADEEDENGRDGDVIAPSDSAIHRDGNRAGHIKGKSTTGGKSPKSASGVARQKGLVIKDSTSVNDGDHSQEDEDSFDDEDYNGVDLISDSEDGGSSAEQLEERLIIDSEEEIPFGFSSDDDGGYDLDGGLFLSDVPYFDEQYGRNDPAVLANEIEIFNSASFFEDNTPPLPTRTGKRRVRFADPVTPSRKSTGNVASESDEDMGPNPFRSADEMASTLWQMKQCVGKRRPINDDERSRWGFDQSEKPAFGSHELNNDRSEGSDGSSSGYETDPGETTEEDDMPPSRPQTLPRRTPASSNNNRPQVRTTSHQHIPAARDRPWGPPLGSWIADPTKPIAITDRTGTSVVIIPAQRPKNGDKKSAQALSSRISPTNKTHRASLSKSTTSLEGSERDRSEVSSQEYEAPNARMLRSGPNLMMSGLLHGAPGNEYLLTGQVLGPPEAFFPFINFNADGDNDQEDEDDDDGEALLNVHDFIDFGDDSEESEGEKERILSFTGDMSQPASVNSQSPNNDAASHTLLDHLGKGVVTAFRRDQHRDKTPPRPFHDNRSKNTDYAFKSGRTDAADTPLSPAKKRKLSNDFNGGSLSPSEPNLKKRALSSHTDTQNLMTC